MSAHALCQTQQPQRFGADASCRRELRPRHCCAAPHATPSFASVSSREPIALRRNAAAFAVSSVRGAHASEIIPLKAVSCEAEVETESAAEAVHERRELGWPRGFEDEFEIENVLGEGSFGIVRAGRQTKTGKRFAVKMISKRKGKKSDLDWKSYSELIQTEVSLWTMVQNSHDAHVVKLRGVYEDDDYLYIVEDLCEGGDLQQFLQGHGNLTEKEAAQAMTGVLHLLAACHDKHVCYGDVKPANFLLESRYPCRRHLVDPSAPKGDIVLKAVDFGCSQQISEDGKLKRRTGTPQYMAPEIFFGWYGKEVDIWAAGMMLYQLLSGKMPFFGDNLEELRKGPSFVIQSLMDNELEFADDKWDDVSNEAKDLISKMLDVDYNSRISARGALQHSWITRYSEHPGLIYSKKAVGISTGNVIDFQGASGEPVET